MEIKRNNKFIEFIKNYGVILISGVFIIAIAITLLVVGLTPDVTETQNKPSIENPDNSGNVNTPEDGEGGGSSDGDGDQKGDGEEDKKPVAAPTIEYGLPMNDASIIKDFSDSTLQYNQTLNRWEAHFSVDLASVESDVMSIYDGTVASVEYDFLMGNIITIEHENGMVSVYASLDKNINVKVGDSVTKGQVIGYASTTATSESADGAHLDFSMILNGEEVDPNNYLSLQNK